MANRPYRVYEILDRDDIISANRKIVRGYSVGRTSTEALRNYTPSPQEARRGEVHRLAFLIEVDGFSIRAEPLEKRARSK